MLLEAVAAGEAAVPLMVDILSRRELREGEPTDCHQIPVHAMRVLGLIGSESAIPALVGVLADPVDPTAYGDEAGLALSRIGDAAVRPIEGLMFDRERDTWVRAGAAQALVFVALVDRRRRARVRDAFARLLQDPRESDRLLLAHVAVDACHLAMTPLLPLLESAYRSGRVDEEFIDLDQVRMELLTRHHRTDRDTKERVRRDVLEEYATWEELLDGIVPEEQARIHRLVARIEREGAAPPRPGDEDVLYAGEFEPGGDDENDDLV
jgi:hypothetical protein